jgi:hypothetical protein
MDHFHATGYARLVNFICTLLWCTFCVRHVHILKVRITALIPLSFDWEIAIMIQLWISDVLVDWYERYYVQFRFLITVIADTDQGQDFCWLKFHYIRIYEYNESVFLSSFQVTYGAIYVLWAQGLVILFPSFYSKEFHYICWKRLFERYENFHLLVQITVYNFS